MSMDFTEFRRWLGADPHSRDPAFLLARESAPEFHQAAAEADRFEVLLQQALAVKVPPAFLAGLGAQPSAVSRIPVRIRKPWALALAAGLALALGATTLLLQSRPSWSSVEDYVVDHYRHDGARVLAMSTTPTPGEIHDLLNRFGVVAASPLASIVSVIKTCPTPDGKGVHMVLETEQGLVTVIYMPDTAVNDGEHMAFDDREAILVELEHGSAVVIGSAAQEINRMASLVQESIRPADGSS